MTGRPKAKPPKRENGTGSVGYVARYDRYRARGPGGKPERLFKTPQEAWDWLDAYAGGTAPTGTMTVGELAELYVTKRGPKWSISHRGTVTSQVGHNIVRQPIGKMRVDRCLVDDVEQWMQTLADAGHVEPTIKTYRSHLDQIFRWGMARYKTVVLHNPVAEAELPDGMRPKGEIAFLNLDEARRLIAFCDRPQEVWGPLFQTIAMLGVRPGEGTGILRTGIDWDRATVSIHGAIERTNATPVQMGATKTRRTRLLEAPPVVMAALRRQMETQDLARQVYADEWPTTWDGLLFLNTQSLRNARAGIPPNLMTLRKHLARICAEAGIPRVTPYGLRHSCASIMLHDGTPPEKVAARLGTSVAMLRLHYEHLIDPVNRDGIDVWSRIDG